MTVHVSFESERCVKKFGMLFSRWKSQWWFRFSVSVCPLCILSMSGWALCYQIWYVHNYIITRLVKRLGSAFFKANWSHGLNPQRIFVSDTYLLNHWTFCDQTGYDYHLDTECCVKKNWIANFKVKVTVMVSILSECLSILYVFSGTEFCVAKLGMLAHHH